MLFSLFEPTVPMPVEKGPSLLPPMVLSHSGSFVFLYRVSLSLVNQEPKRGFSAGTESAMRVPPISEDSMARNGS